MISTSQFLSPANRRGIVATLAAMGSFAASDTLMKMATETLPVPEVLVVRSLFALALLFILMRGTGELHLRPVLRHPRILLRTAFEVALVLTWLYGLKYVSVGEATAVLQTVPLLLTAWAALVRKEPVGLGGWLAIFAGFTGILLIVKPSSSGVDAAMLLLLAAALAAAGRDVITRSIPPHISSRTITLVSTLAGGMGGAILALNDAWRGPDLREYAIIIGAALMVTLGQFFIIRAYRAADIAVLSPFRYVSVPFSLIASFLIWGHTPDILSWFGIFIVVAAGLYTIAPPQAAKRPR